MAPNSPTLPDATSIEIADGESIHLYSCRLFPNPVFVPLPKYVGTTIDNVVLHDLAQSDSFYDLIYGIITLDNFSLSIKGTTAIIDFAGEHSKAVAIFPETIPTLWATLTMNNLDIEHVRFLLQGAAFPHSELASIYNDYPAMKDIIDSEGYCVITDYSLPEYSSGEMAQLRKQTKFIPRPGIDNDSYYPMVDYMAQQGLPDPRSDTQTGRMFSVIFEAARFGVPSTSFTRIQNAPDSFTHTAAIWYTTQFYWDSDPDLYDERYAPHLAPLSQVIALRQAYLENHVDQAASILFGPEFTMHHGSSAALTGRRYDEYSGTYTVLHGHGPLNAEVPFILGSSSRYDEFIDVEVAFITFASAWYDEAMFLDAYRNVLQPEEVLDYAQTQAERHIVTLRIQDDGSLTYWGHLLPKDISPSDDNDQHHRVVFPAHERQKTVYSASIFDIEPFAVSFWLPEDWQVIDDPEVTGGPFYPTWSLMSVLDETNTLVGVIGYYTYEQYPGAEEIPQAIYGAVGVGNGDQFNIWETYRQVRQSPVGATAIMEVQYGRTLAYSTKTTNRGILSYNRDLQVYVTMEFTYDFISTEQYLHIAHSLRFD